MVKSCVLLGMLGTLSVEDVRSKKLNVIILSAFGILGVILHMIYQKGEYLSLLGGVGVGFAMGVVSLLSRGRVGMGDALALIVTGIFLGGRGNLTLFLVSQILAACMALFLIIVRKKGKDYEMPFLPFLLVSYVGMLAAGGMA